MRSFFERRLNQPSLSSMRTSTWSTPLPASMVLKRRCRGLSWASGSSPGSALCSASQKPRRGPLAASRMRVLSAGGVSARRRTTEAVRDST